MVKQLIVSCDLRMIDASGIGTYIKNTINSIAQQLPHVHFYFLGNTAKINEAFPCLSNNVNLIPCDAPIYSIKEQFQLRQRIPKNTDLFWSPHYNIPLFYKGKLLVTIHDVFHLAIPELTGGFHKRLYAKWMFKAVAKRASKILTVSQFSKSEIIKYLHIESARIHVIPNGIDSFWLEDENTERVHANKYFLFVGNVKPHKNLKRLVEAFKQIMNLLPHDLIVVGKKEGFLTGDADTVATAQQYPQRILFTGHISNETLRQYYRHAEALVFPSLYEGFGLPPLEAMGQHCPVLASDIPPLKEVCGDAVVTFNPLDIDDMKQKMIALPNNSELRESLINKGLAQVSKYSWENSVNETIKQIKELI